MARKTKEIQDSYDFPNIKEIHKMDGEVRHVDHRLQQFDGLVYDPDEIVSTWRDSLMAGLQMEPKQEQWIETLEYQAYGPREHGNAWKKLAFSRKWCQRDITHAFGLIVFSESLCVRNIAIAGNLDCLGTRISKLPITARFRNISLITLEKCITIEEFRRIRIVIGNFLSNEGTVLDTDDYVYCPRGLQYLGSRVAIESLENAVF